jgi:hypothetical protein
MNARTASDWTATCLGGERNLHSRDGHATIGSGLERVMGNLRQRRSPLTLTRLTAPSGGPASAFGRLRHFDTIIMVFPNRKKRRGNQIDIKVAGMRFGALKRRRVLGGVRDRKRRPKVRSIGTTAVPCEREHSFAQTMKSRRLACCTLVLRHPSATKCNSLSGMSRSATVSAVPCTPRRKGYIMAHAGAAVIAFGMRSWRYRRRRSVSV